MKKKKFFVFPQLPFVVIGLAVSALTVYIITMVSSNAYGGNQLLIAVCTIMLVILPILLVIIEIVLMWAQIAIDENGITKYLFGKRIKFFSWNEICDIKGLNNPIPYAHPSLYIVFCNKPISEAELKFSVRKKCTIPISRRQEVLDEINKYKQNAFMN